LKTADNPFGAPSAYFEQMRAAWAADYPKWLQENGPPFDASPAEQQMVKGISIPDANPHDPDDHPERRKLARTLNELYDYLGSNRDIIPDNGDHRRHGEAISSWQVARDISTLVAGK
jgi:hypothetical protein